MRDQPETGYKPAIIIGLLALLQVLCATYFLDIPGFYASASIVFLLSGLGISFFVLQVPVAPFTFGEVTTRQNWIRIVVLLILLPVSYYFCRQILDATPLQKEHADMLPIMEVMGSRFIEGQWKEVYEPIPEIWQGVQPIYLPAFWMPFTTALVFDFDMRWVTVGGIWLSVLFCIWPGRWKRQLSSLLLPVSLLLLLAWFHFDSVNNVIRLTQEGVVFFYYSLLVVSIFLRKAWLIGIAAALCLLSRYALVGWLPFAFLFLLLTRQYRFLLHSAGSGILVILLLAVIPFGWKPFLVHLDLHSSYVPHAQRIWNENPEYLTQSLGMAKFFGAGNMDILHTILLAGSFALPMSFLFLWKKKYPAHLVLIASLQFTLTFFYTFLDVSYLYLYYTPVFVSLVIAAWSLAAPTRL